MVNGGKVGWNSVDKWLGVAGPTTIRVNNSIIRRFMAWLRLMKGLEYDASQTGFHAVLKDWQLKAMQVVWTSPNGANSRTVHQKVNQALIGETISRASIINYLEDMREMGVLSGEERTGRGGHHWVYFPKLDEAGFKTYIVEKMIACLMESFPDETWEVIRKQIE